MTVWEYLVLEGVSLGGGATTYNIQTELSKHGEDGWELVTIQNFELAKGEQTLVIFKRPMQIKKVKS